MTISEIELAGVNYMSAKLGADASLTGIDFLVRADNEVAAVPMDRCLVLLRSDGLRRTIPNLLDTNMEIVLVTPVDLADFGMAEHGAMETAIAKAWDKVATPTARADWDAIIKLVALGWNGADFFTEGWQAGREDTNLAPIFTVKLGVMRDGV